jgi:hypothetical protein
LVGEKCHFTFVLIVLGRQRGLVRFAYRYGESTFQVTVIADIVFVVAFIPSFATVIALFHQHRAERFAIT